MAGEKEYVNRLIAVAKAMPPENRRDLYVHWLQVDRIPADVVKMIEREFPLGKRVVIEELREPTVVEMAENFGKAMVEWRAAGWKVVTDEVYEEISRICDPCGFWNPNVRKGLGKCMHKECGCSVFKRWLVTSRCPIGKWSAKMVVPKKIEAKGYEVVSKEEVKS